MIFPAVPLLLLDFSIQTQSIWPRWFYLPFRLRIPADIKERKFLPPNKNKNFSMPENYLWCEKYVVFGVFFFYRESTKAEIKKYVSKQKEERKKKFCRDKEDLYRNLCRGFSSMNIRIQMENDELQTFGWVIFRSLSCF